MKSLKKIGKLIVINSLVLLILLLIVEYSLRHTNTITQMGLQSYSYERFIELKEFIPAVEVSSYSNNIEAIELLEVNVALPCLADSNGLLVSKNSVNQESILLLGDAQTSNLDLDPNERIHHLLFNKLDSSYQIINASYPSSDLIHSTNKLVNILLPMRPKVVLINHNLTDLLLLAKNGSYWNKIIGDKKKARVSTTPFVPNVSLKKVEDSIILKEYTKALSNIGQLLSNWHITPIFITQAFNHYDSLNLSKLLQVKNIHITNERVSALHRKINQEIRAICKDNNWSIIDLERVLNSNPLYFNNYLLFNSSGAKEACQHISDSLKRWELVKTTEPTLL